MEKRETSQVHQWPAWQWNEIQQVGTDYADVAEVERYEQRMGEFRNLPAEDAAILDRLALPAGSHILEIGTGTGHFARAAARAGYRVTALDVSPATFDAAVSVAVLHHLPDLWKAVALGNIHRALKPGGLFLLCDVVFSSQHGDPRSQFEAFSDAVPQSMRDGAIGHIAREYSTLDWIMEGLLTRAGFTIERMVDSQAPLVQYQCKAARQFA